MNISNSDLILLHNIEHELWNNNSNLYVDLWELIEKLENQKTENNKKNWERIKEKRKTDKNYARGKAKKMNNK